jgi:choline dehydrogenase-like flavoprotein
MALTEDAADGGGVVDEELKVFGVLGLRVADSSVFPWVLRTHLQAPTVCVAEKCAEMVLDENNNKNKKREAWEVWYRLTQLKNRNNSTTA